MKKKKQPSPEDFWIKLAPNELDDPTFRAAAIGTIYCPAPDDPDDWRSDIPTVPSPATMPEEKPSLPPDPWPGL